MRKFHVFNWNKRNVEHTMLIFTEDDIENESQKYKGAGFEILILPSKYKNINNKYLDVIRDLVNFRSGEIIYI